ncbi:MAG: DUF3267 domain-containing protein [Lysinibacillus sp.]
MTKTNEAMQKRLIMHEALRTDMLSQSYEEKNCTISVVKANIYTLLITLPFIIPLIILYVSIWGEFIFTVDLATFAIVMAAFFISIPVHEAIHRFTFAAFCKNGLKSIHYGILWNSLTPYCHCSEPLKFKHYITGGLMPFIILGLGVNVNPKVDHVAHVKVDHPLVTSNKFL